ncbi:hypothetical protein LSTR_LSTR007145 [Laodelphax striatellus]|uniref:G-protein coupled receptors family 2 profile 2 domain-containing protein n=1 Tax=Laodelphax striatellus TaxID=195883 RepID=A0A482WWA7_LAOST|nr:hypothetical protein LSTR_LSTR007145 [Laodelphax striatellus]
MNRSIIYPAELNFNNCLHFSSHNLFLYLFSTSLVFLSLTVIVYLSLPTLRTLGGKIIIGELISVILSFLFLVLILIFKDEFSFNICLLMGYTTHYALLCHFFWLNVMSFDIWLTFRTNAEINWMRSERRILAKKEAKRLKYYILYACGVPLLIVLLTYMAQILLPRENAINPRVGHIKCFIEQSTSKNVFYFYPLTVLAVLNIIMFSATAQKIFLETKKTKLLYGGRSNSRALARLRLEKRRFLIYLKLFVAMGVPWLAEPLSGISGHFRCGWLLLDLFNASLGLPVFLLFICQRRTLCLLKQRLFPGSKPSYPCNNSLSSSSHTSMMSRLSSNTLLIAAKYENTRL